MLKKFYSVILVFLILSLFGCEQRVQEPTMSEVNEYTDNYTSQLLDKESIDDFSVPIKGISDIIDDQITGVIYFGRDTCTPCLIFNNMIKESIPSDEEVVIYKFDTDEWRSDPNFQFVLDKYEIGSILGKNDPETFLELYAVAKIVQQAAMEYHLKPLIDQANSNPDLSVDNTLVCVINNDSSAEVQSHALWNLMLHEGVPLPDCGIYYTGLGSALVSPEKDVEIFRHLSDYAICVVALEME